MSRTLSGKFLVGACNGREQGKKNIGKIPEQKSGNSGKSGKFPKSEGTPPKRTENWCCANFVEQCRKSFLKLFDNFGHFWPCTEIVKNVDLCLDTFDDLECGLHRATGEATNYHQNSKTFEDHPRGGPSKVLLLKMQNLIFKNKERKISLKFFRPKFFRGRPRGVSVPKCLDIRPKTSALG